VTSVYTAIKNGLSVKYDWKSPALGKASTTTVHALWIDRSWGVDGCMYNWISWATGAVDYMVKSSSGWPLSRPCEILMIPWRFAARSAALGMLSVTHIMSVLVLLSVVG